MFNRCRVTIHVNNADAAASTSISSKTDKDAVSKPVNYQQLYYLQRASHVAQRSNVKHHRHGCVIVNNTTGKILVEGYNHKQDRNTLSHIDSIHAEMHALQRYKPLRKQFPSCSIYVVRIGQESQGNPMKYSHPCPKCSEMIRNTGIRHVFYSINNEPEVAYTQLCNWSLESGT
jgi:deoxycytidylate deaminase